VNGADGAALERARVEYLVLARRYRPQTFDEVVGQDHVSRTLKNAITQGRLAHAYLFTGPRGVGKTSSARILAKSLNCVNGPTTTPCGVCDFCADIAAGRSLDVIEIDGASNRGIDEIRDLRENARYAASPGKKRIYIVDEVHMLTNEARNALLKILEEPPPHVLFIFATTQPSKVLPTILSRCQRFDFRRIPTEAIVGRLREIGAKEKFALDDDVYYLIARRADGGLRDAESLLDQVISFAGKKASREQAEEVLGIVGSELYFALGEAIAQRNAASAAERLAAAIDGGADVIEIATGMLDHLRSLFIAALGESPGEILDTSPEMVARLAEQAKAFSSADLLRLARILAHAEREMRRSTHARVLLELAIFEMVSLDASVDLGDLLSRLEAAGIRPASGGAAGRPRASAPASASAVARAATAPASMSTAGRATTAAASTPPTARSSTAPASTLPTARSSTASANTPPASDLTPPVNTREDGADAVRPIAKSAMTATATGSSLTIDVVRARWREFVEAIGGSKRSLAAFLEHGAPLEIERGILVLGFAEGSAFPREQVEHAEHRALVERELSKLLGERVAVKTRLVRDNAARASRDSGAANGETRAARATGATTATSVGDAERTPSTPGDASNFPSALGTRGQPILENPNVRRALEFFDAEVVSRGRAPSQKNPGLFGGDETPRDAVEGETA
jgi:DNA polymerase-3 subunit gamma/tau